MRKEKKQPSPTIYREKSRLMRILAVLTFIGAFIAGAPRGIFFGIVAIFAWRLGTKYLKMATESSDNTAQIPSGDIPRINLKSETHNEYIGENHFVAGTSYHRDELLELAHENEDYHLSKKELEEEYYGTDPIYQYEFFPDKVELVPEPTNEYDPNAIKVIVDGQHIGYIKKGLCNHIHKLINENRIMSIDCDIYGGNYKELIVDDYSDKSKIVKSERNFGAKVILRIKKEV